MFDWDLMIVDRLIISLSTIIADFYWSHDIQNHKTIIDRLILFLNWKSSNISDELDDSYKMKTSNRHKSKKDDKQGLFPASADIEDIVPFPSSSNTAIQDERMCLLSDKCTPEKLRK